MILTLIFLNIIFAQSIPKKTEFEKNWSKIKKLGYDENFKRLWEYYLTYCEVGFINGSIDVSQFLLEKKRLDND